jgi:fructose-1,6-bisphosphatase
MAFILEQAGGASWSGKESLLDAKEGDVDARVPLYMGGKAIMEKLRKALG